MGIFYGRNANDRSNRASAWLAAKITRKGGRNSTGASTLLDMMSGRTAPGELRGEEAEQAAQSLRGAANRMRGDARTLTLKIADDAEAASNSGGRWTLSG
ncbi:hypothetical protein ACIHFD_49305 [Nonomuraea sp. NPDC051941]|uniref:DUF7739 domain-containing protein n=1 Tax=Nonomuraea sp. NPDC051941 TaxID=3364373 RepID=UPI0037C5C02D